MAAGAEASSVSEEQQARRLGTDKDRVLCSHRNTGITQMFTGSSQMKGMKGVLATIWGAEG